MSNVRIASAEYDDAGTKLTVNVVGGFKTGGYKVLHEVTRDDDGFVTDVRVYVQKPPPGARVTQAARPVDVTFEISGPFADYVNLANDLDS